MNLILLKRQIAKSLFGSFCSFRSLLCGGEFGGFYVSEFKWKTWPLRLVCPVHDHLWRIEWPPTDTGRSLSQCSVCLLISQNIRRICWPKIDSIFHDGTSANVVLWNKRTLLYFPILKLEMSVCHKMPALTTCKERVLTIPRRKVVVQ